MYVVKYISPSTSDPWWVLLGGGDFYLTYMVHCMYNYYEVIKLAKSRRNFYIDDKLYDEFRTYSRLTNITMTEVIEESILNFNQIMKQLLNGMSAGELIDYSHFKLYQATKQVDELPEGRNTRATKLKEEKENQ